MMQAVGREAASPALQLWEAYHSSSALAGTLRGAVRAHQECEHLAQLLETVSELLCFVFSRFNDALFLGSLNTHVASAAQLLHFGLLKVCRVADSCCSNSSTTRSSSTTPFSPATTTSSAASAAADIQLAVTVLATAVQYLETTHSAKQCDAAATKVLPGPRASLQLQQQVILQSSKDAADASRTSARRSTGGARQLSEQLDAVQLSNSAADEGTAVLAGSPYSSRHSASSACGHWEQQQSGYEDAAQPAVAGELTFNEQWPLERPAGISTAPWQANAQQQQQPTEPPAASPAAEPAEAPADAIDPEAYQAAKLQALQELLQPGTTWSLEEGGAGFVCKPSRSRSSSPQQQHQQSCASSPAKSPAVQQAGQSYAASPAEQDNVNLTLNEQQDGHSAAQPAAAAAAEEAVDTAVADLEVTDVAGNNTDTNLAAAVPEELEEQLQQEDSAQEQGLQDADTAVSSTAWLQQQLQQIYSNALLQGRKPQQQRHSTLRRSQKLMCGVVDAAELPLLPARAQSPEPAGLGVGFVAAGYNSSSGSGGRSWRASTEDLVEAVLGRRARTTGGGTGTSSRGSGGGGASGMYGSSMAAAAAAAGVVRVLYEPSDRAAGLSRPGRGRRSPSNSAPGSTRMSVDVVTPGYDSRGSSGSGMVGTCSPRGYAGRSYASRAASVTGSVRGSSSTGAAGGQRRGTSSSPGAAARAASSSGSGCVTPTKPGRASSPSATAAPGSCSAGRGGSSSGGQTSKSRRASSSPGQASLTAGGEWQGLTAAASPRDAASGRSPSRTGSPSPARQSQSGVKASRDSILSSSSRSSIPAGGSSSGGGDGAGSVAYEEALAAAAAAAAVSAAGTVYKSANSSGNGSSAGAGGLSRRSSAGSTMLFISARSSRAGSTAGSVISCHEGTGRMRTSSTGGAAACSVTSAAGVSVLGMLAAAAAGAAEEAAAAAGVGEGVALNRRSLQEGSRKGSSQGESWLEPPATLQQRPARSLSGMSAGTSTGSSSGLAGLLPYEAEDGMLLGSSAAAAQAADAGGRDTLVTGMGCLTLGSCSGATPGRASLVNGGGSAAMAESVRLSRCSLKGIAAAAGGGSRQLSGELAVMQQQLQQQQEAGAGSRSGSSAGSRMSGRVGVCSIAGEREADVTSITDATDADLQDEQQQQQQREVLGFLAAARQDTKQGHKCSAGGAAAAVASAADGLAVAHTLPVSPVKQHSAALPLGDHRWSRSSASADGAVIAAAGSQHAAAGVDAWQHQQEQWQQQWQQQQQVWQQQVEQQALVASEPEDGAQQQVEEEFSLCPVRVQPGSAAQAEQQQQQGHTAEVEEAEYQVGVCLQPGDAAATAAAHEPGGKDKVCSTTAADSDDFGDFQGSPHADAPGTYFRGSTDAAATETAEAVGEKPAAAAEVCDRNSFMVHGTAERTPLAPDAAAADPAAATATTASADASSFAQASTPEAAAEALLAQGNAAYTAGKYSPAVQCYAKALGSLGGSIAATTSEAGVLLWIKCSLNLACCHLRLGQFKQCVALCDNLLEVDPANIVALCHRGRALLMVQQHAEAKADLTAALELLEEEAAEQTQQQQTYLGHQQQRSTRSEDVAVSDGQLGEETAAAARAGEAVLGPLQAADGGARGGAVRPSSRCLSPCTLARMRLNNGYWQQRVVGLLASITSS